MAEIYNTSFMNNATNPLDLILGLNNVIGSQFLIGNLILLSFFLIFLILAFRVDFNEILLIDCFLTTVLAILLYTSGGLVAAATIAYPAVLFFISVIFYLITK